MIDVQTHLLLKLCEECGEVTQEASKCGIFGTEEKYTPEHDINWDRLSVEVHDVVAVYKMIAAHLNKDARLDPDLLIAKQIKVWRYMDHARETGMLEKLDG